MQTRKAEVIMKRFGCSLSGLFLLGILMTGCNTTQPTHVVFHANGKGPLSSIKPLTVLVQVENQRPPDEQDSVVLRRTAIGGTDTWCTKKPLPLIVQDALKSELSKCGHRAITETATPSNARVKIVLKRFRDFEDSRISEKALIEAELVGTSESRNITTPPFHINGNYQHQVGMFYKGPDEAMNKALAEFIHNLTFDS